MAGDPISGLKWTHKSLRKLSTALRKRRLPAGHGTVARLLQERQFSLRTNRKRLARTNDPQSDRQFRYLARVRRWYLTRGLPVISVDTKKKELVGNFKNPGRCWRREGRSVLDHDFPSWAIGPGIPYGIYDVGRNAGYTIAERVLPRRGSNTRWATWMVSSPLVVGWPLHERTDDLRPFQWTASSVIRE